MEVAARADSEADAHRPGRRRDPSRDAAILAAALALFEEQGYGGVSIEGVAARAGVGKATIYRRYRDKAALVVEAVKVGACLDDHLPDTGDLRADLSSMLQRMVDKLRGDNGRVLLVFAAERLRHPELATEFERSVIGAKRAHTRRLVAGAVERGIIPAGSDVGLIAECGPALIWHHALHGLPLTDDLADRIVDLVLPGPVNSSPVTIRPEDHRATVSGPSSAPG
ncbi:MAG: TetR/AcrR family transcriptional regulator [Acidimicrobiales bacterium]